MEKVKTLFVPVGQDSFLREFDEMETIIHMFGEMITTFNSGIPGVGIIAGDQDDQNIPVNVLGIRGDFVVVGMERIESTMQMHKFRSLEEFEVDALKVGLEKSIRQGVMVDA